jgi:hypothetical protein
MMIRIKQSPIVASVVLNAAALLLAMNAEAQFGPPPAPQGAARDLAPIDLTGQWVSIVTEDWRFRMLTPARNDYPGLPLNPAARAIADEWDPARDEAEGNACMSYGAGAIMRVPTRLRISWDGPNELEIETDAGRQTRLLNFGDAPRAADDSSWQGQSVAEWEFHFGRRGQPPANGNLKVVTTNMLAGYFRKNGVPYSENAVLTEYFDLLTQHDGSEWLVVLSVLDDPTYFTGPIITSTNFRRQANRNGWSPSDCSAF